MAQQQRRPVLSRTQPKVTSPRAPSSSSSIAALKRPPMLLIKKISSENTVPRSPEQDHSSSSHQNFDNVDDLQLKNSKTLKRPSSRPKINVELSVQVDSIPLLKRAPSPRELQAQRKAKIAHYGRRIGSPKSIPEESFLTPVPNTKKRCEWITSQSDPVHIAYHDQEWGVPVHDDKLLFELLTLASAQSEVSWSVILKKREIYRAAFSGFDPAVIATYTSSRVAETRSSMDILQQDGKVQCVVDNARKVVEIVQEFGSFDSFMWSFVNHKPIVTSFRMSSHVSIKSSRSEVLSKDLIRRGFRGVAPAIVYSFMQAAGLTNDHTLHCFRHKEICSDHAKAAV